MHAEAQAWIHRLSLAPHPEGGWYRETYKSDILVETARGPRPAGTVIYFLLAGDNVSHLHRLAADEIWHFYAGGPLTLHLLAADGPRSLNLGPAALQAVVPAHTWFGAWLNPGTAYALVGCTMAPGFDFDDFELGAKAELLRRFPQQRDLIETLAIEAE